MENKQYKTTILIGNSAFVSAAKNLLEKKSITLEEFEKIKERASKISERDNKQYDENLVIIQEK